MVMYTCLTCILRVHDMLVSKQVYYSANAFGYGKHMIMPNIIKQSVARKHLLIRAIRSNTSLILHLLFSKKALRFYRNIQNVLIISGTDKTYLHSSFFYKE